MDLEQIFQNAGTMDAQNVTLLLLSALAQFGSNTTSKRPAATFDMSDKEFNHTTVEDNDVLLAVHLGAMLMKYYSNDPALWNAVVANLEKEEIRRKAEANWRLSTITSTVLISIYMLVIAIGTFGNLLVIAAFARQPELRSRGNAFIINLAVSDLLLCFVTMPLTLIELLNDHWPLGDSVMSCKAAGGLQAVSVFVSTITITVIALDRYQLIVYPTKDVLERIGAVAGIFLIWIMGFCLASPIFVFRTLEHFDLGYHRKGNESDAEDQILRSGNVHSIDYCYEKWPVTHGQAIYSAFTLLVQYVVPILVISVLHTQICQRLGLRHSTMGSIMGPHNSQRQIEERKRLRRRHRLLMAISLIFSITWLPLNVLNLIIDLCNPFTLPRDNETMYIIYATCHLFGMSSACANPFLYGWFNENFRVEFKLVFAAPYRLLCPARPASAGHQRRPSIRNSSALPSAAHSISKLGHSKLRRTATTQSSIDTNTDERNNVIKKNNTIELSQQPQSTEKQMTVVIDHRNIMLTKSISRLTSSASPAERQNNIDSDGCCQARSDEIDEDVIVIHPILSPVLDSSSATLETHL